jgi:Zn-dependent M28 family amino/carboxypeptidase
MNKIIIVFALSFLLGCSPQSNNQTSEVDMATIGKHIETLASDDFMGRMPFTEGETKTTTYLANEFKKLGLLPGNGDSFFQEVPLVEITGTPSATMSIKSAKKNFNLKYYDDFVALTLKTDDEVSLVESEMVFAGYGVVAPEYGWNDYAGIDWKGKTAVVLVNDPGFQSGDTTLFKGDKMTYYGRWTYKYEEAGRQGAAGVIIVHQTEPASYGWNVIQSGWTGTKLNLESNRPVADVQGWISLEAATKLFQAAGITETDYRALARRKDFKPIPLGFRASVTIKNKIKRDVSRNVAALLPGSERKDECIIYSAHWDHFGIGVPIANDSIYNGAVDNASGTACLLAIAEAFKKGIPPERSILFLAVTAEEQGLLGSAYYSEHPIFPPTSTVANINMDALDSPGKMKDLTITGFGHSEMDAYAKTAAAKQGRYVIPDPEPQKGFFFRSDHFNFAKIGIPALYAKGGYESIEKGVEYVKQKSEDYEKNRYHQPSDEYDPQTTDLSGVQQDAQLMYDVGLTLGNENYFPAWYESSEFRAVRLKSLETK